MSNYRPKTVKQLKSWYNSKVKAGTSDFTDLHDFLKWYNQQEKVCHYCNLSEEESQALVMRGLLTSNRFPQKGVIGQGTSRGAWLEIDRADPKGKYSRRNSVLCCYFCNNDKSDIFSANQYKRFVTDRPGFLRTLLKGMTSNR
jgi:hypothetical protein